MENESHYQKEDAESVRQRLLKSLVEAGYSNTRPRRVILDLLVRGEGRLTAGEILKRAKAQHRGIGLVTVYRTLDILMSLNLVRRIHSADGCQSYAVCEARHGHHIVCERCHQVIEFAGCDLSPLFARVAQETGYEVRDHWLELSGLCPRCRIAPSRAISEGMSEESRR